MEEHKYDFWYHYSIHDETGEIRSTPTYSDCMCVCGGGGADSYNVISRIMGVQGMSCVKSWYTSRGIVTGNVNKPNISLVMNMCVCVGGE